MKNLFLFILLMAVNGLYSYDGMEGLSIVAASHVACNKTTCPGKCLQVPIGSSTYTICSQEAKTCNKNQTLNKMPNVNETFSHQGNCYQRVSLIK